MVCISTASKPASRASAKRSAYDSALGSIEMRVDLWIVADAPVCPVADCAPKTGRTAPATAAAVIDLRNARRSPITPPDCGITLPSLSKQIPHRAKLVRVDRVPHPLVDAFVDLCFHSAKPRRGLAYSFQWNVRIDVAAAQKHRRIRQRARVVARSAGWTD